MSDLENFENEGGAVAPEPTPAPTPPAEGDWNGPTREEWNAFQETSRRQTETIQGLMEVFGNSAQPQEQGDFDFSQLDMTDPYQAAWLMDQIVQARMGDVAPYVRNAAQDQGQRQMQELLGEHENSLKKDFPLGFDHKLAERASFAFFDETGDAKRSVEMGARYAAETRKAERDSAIKEYQASTRKGSAFFDPDATRAGVSAPEPLKTYEEVLDKWTQQSEL